MRHSPGGPTSSLGPSQVSPSKTCQKRNLLFHGLAPEKGETERILEAKIQVTIFGITFLLPDYMHMYLDVTLSCVLQEILECKMNLKRRIVLKQTTRLKDSNSNSPPVLVTFEDQV